MATAITSCINNATTDAFVTNATLNNLYVKMRTTYLTYNFGF